MTRTMSVSARFTTDEYLALPESPPGVRFELLDGELVTMNDPLPMHQKVVARILARLLAWCDEGPGRGQALLPIDTQVGDDTIFGPDLQWYAAERELPAPTERPWPAGDLVVEVVSPSTARYDVAVKADRYLQAGTREVWLVSTEPSRVRVLHRGSAGAVETSELAGDDVLETPMLPGFRLAVGGLAG